MAIRIAPGASIRGLQPEMVLGAHVIAGVYERVAGADAILTSGTDGEHSRKSLHYPGFAADFRIWNVPEDERERLAGEAQKALGDEFDAVLKPNHLHVEFQPKAPL